MNRLRELRKEKKLTLKEVSSQLEQNNLKISPDALAKYERGDREPKLETCQKLADFFDVSVLERQMQGNIELDDVIAVALIPEIFSPYQTCFYGAQYNE